MGSDNLLNADNQSESEDDDTNVDCTVLYDVDESDAIQPRTAAADAGECCDVCLVEPSHVRTRRAGAMRASAFLHI